MARNAGLKMNNSKASRAIIIEAVMRAAKRSANAAHRELKRGLNSLATIASTAPLIGLFGTVLGIVNSFPGVTGDRRSNMATNFRLLADALLPTLLGLLVAVPSLWLYNWFGSEMQAFDLEMEAATLELANFLTIRLRHRR
jgi:biopolymer transport protein ExbB/TolQ